MLRGFSQSGERSATRQLLKAGSPTLRARVRRVVSLALDWLFVVVQTVQHRHYFLPPGADLAAEEHAAPPSDRQTPFSLGLLVVALVADVRVAKMESKPIESAVPAVGAPQSAVGVVIALLGAGTHVARGPP